MIAEIKDFNDVLVLTRGLVTESAKQLADGFQAKDLVPIVSENFQKAIEAVEGANNIPAIWKAHDQACTELTVEFAIDLACDLLKVPATDAEFKETNEILTAVAGVTASIVKKAKDGLNATEMFEVVSENLNSIIVAGDGASKVSEEFKASPRAFIKMVALFAVKLAFSLRVK